VAPLIAAALAVIALGSTAAISVAGFSARVVNNANTFSSGTMQLKESNGSSGSLSGHPDEQRHPRRGGRHHLQQLVDPPLTLLAAGASQSYTFSAMLDSSATNADQGLAASMTMTWNQS
jgi:hypothetical protein